MDVTARGRSRRRYRELAERTGVELDNLQERIDQTANAVESSATELIEDGSARDTAGVGRTTAEKGDIVAGTAIAPAASHLRLAQRSASRHTIRGRRASRWEANLI